jgi:MFS family permease
VLAAAAAFELGNLAAALLILRATGLLEPGRSHASATQLALVLYTGYNLAATLASVPAGHAGDRRGMLGVLAAGAACFVLAYLGLAFTGESFALLAGCFILAGIGIGCAETAETAAVAQLAPDHLRGSAFGFLAALQAIGNLAASAIAGLLWTAVSPTAAFLYVAAWTALAMGGLLLTALPHEHTVI